MANDLYKKQYVRAIIELFLCSIDQKKINNIPLTDDELRWISSKQGLISYVYEQKAYPVYTTDATHTGKDTKVTKISESSVYKAIAQMEVDGLIEVKDRQIQIKHETNDYDFSPILGIAPRLQITHLPLDDIALFRVPQRYASAIAHYINTQFYCNDICCVAISGYILCFDVSLPNKCRIADKGHDLITRVNAVIKPFNRTLIQDAQEYVGITHAQKNKRDMDRLLATSNLEQARETAYGGAIRVPVKRKIKKS